MTDTKLRIEPGAVLVVVFAGEDAEAVAQDQVARAETEDERLRGVGNEVVGRILGGDPALDGMAV